MEKCKNCGGSLKEVNASLMFYDPVIICSVCRREHVKECPVVKATTPPGEIEWLNGEPGSIEWLTEDFTDLLDLPKGSVNCILNTGIKTEKVKLRHVYGAEVVYMIAPNYILGFPPDYVYLTTTLPDHLKVHRYGVE